MHHLQLERPRSACGFATQQLTQLTNYPAPKCNKHTNTHTTTNTHSPPPPTSLSLSLSRLCSLFDAISYAASLRLPLTGKRCARVAIYNCTYVHTAILPRPPGSAPSLLQQVFLSAAHSRAQRQQHINIFVSCALAAHTLLRFCGEVPASAFTSTFAPCCMSWPSARTAAAAAAITVFVIRRSANKQKVRFAQKAKQNEIQLRTTSRTIKNNKQKYRINILAIWAWACTTAEELCCVSRSESDSNHSQHMAYESYIYIYRQINIHFH